MKRVVVLVFVLLSILSSVLFSETLDCSVSFMLGSINAMSEYRSWRWFLLGLGSSIPTMVMLGLEYSGVFQDYDSWAIFSEYAAFVPLFIPLIPSILFPQSQTIHAPHGIEVTLDSYRRGYKTSATLKNVLMAAAGEAAGIAAFIAIAMLFDI